MFINNSFGRTVDILHRSMDITTLRRSVISDNIANSDTPNFKRSVVNYESQLRRAFESQRKPPLEGKVTHEKHISFHNPVDYRSVGPRRVLDYLTQSKNNGNNVDIEEEMITSLQNQLNYQMLANVISNQFTQVNSVLR